MAKRVKIENADSLQFEKDWNKCFYKVNANVHGTTHKLDRKKLYAVMRKYNLDDVVVKGAGLAFEARATIVTDADEKIEYWI